MSYRFEKLANLATGPPNVVDFVVDDIHHLSYYKSADLVRQIPVNLDRQ